MDEVNKVCRIQFWKLHSVNNIMVLDKGRK